MALLPTFPKLGASPGIRLSGALPRNWARSITDRSLRPIGTAFGGLRSVQAGVPGVVCKLLFLPPGERYSGTGLTPAREREETFRALGQWLRAYSGKRPVLLVVEDLHWIDASTLE